MNKYIWDEENQQRRPVGAGPKQDVEPASTPASTKEALPRILYDILPGPVPWYGAPGKFSGGPRTVEQTRRIRAQYIPSPNKKSHLSDDEIDEKILEWNEMKAEGHSLRRAASKMGVAESTLRGWISSARVRGIVNPA